MASIRGSISFFPLRAGLERLPDLAQRVHERASRVNEAKRKVSARMARKLEEAVEKSKKKKCPEDSVLLITRWQNMWQDAKEQYYLAAYARGASRSIPPDGAAGGVRRREGHLCSTVRACMPVRRRTVSSGLRNVLRGRRTALCLREIAESELGSTLTSTHVLRL